MTQLHIPAPLAATVAHIAARAGTRVRAGEPLLYLEIMKMEQPLPSPVDGVVFTVAVEVGDTVEQGQRLLSMIEGPRQQEGSTGSKLFDAENELEPSTEHAERSTESAERSTAAAGGDTPLDDDSEEDVTGQSSSLDRSDLLAPRVREDLTAVLDRRAKLTDDARPQEVARRHERGHRTARENVSDLVDPDSFSEYGGLAIAAQRNRRTLQELIDRTPADGLITGTATVNADVVDPARAAVAVAAYDYSVLAGTQGWTNHQKLDRLLGLASAHGLPLVVFAEGGGGRPGDTDVVGGSWLDAAAFHLFARMAGKLPLVAVVNGHCFAGNAALAGSADVIIATSGSSLGMAGPAMIEGGGLGTVDPADVGPMDVQTANGVVDVLVDDEQAAVAVARKYLSYTQGQVDQMPEPADQTLLREAVPENRKRAYDLRRVLDTLSDPDSVLELRPDHAPGMLTAFARINGHPIGVLGNLSAHLGGAIDADGADSATRHMELCESYGLPLLVLCDTPGFMVGPEAEREGGVRRFSRMFLAGARLTVPVLCVITRKAYGLGAQAIMGGHLKVPALTLAWPTAELGPMGLEGAVKLGFRRELVDIEDPDDRREREDQLVDLAYDAAQALNVATFAEIDDVIDPADTRRRLILALSHLL